MLLRYCLTCFNLKVISLAPLFSSLIDSKGIGGLSVGSTTVVKVNKSVVVVCFKNKIVREMEGMRLYMLWSWFIKLGVMEGKVV